MKNERSTAIKAAIRAELLLLLADGEDLNADTLGRIRHICDYSTDLIKAIEAPIGASAYPMDLKRAVEASQVAFACNIDETGQSALPSAPGIAAANATLALPSALLPEQLPGETMAVRLLRELITLVRERQGAVLAIQPALTNGAVA